MVVPEFSCKRWFKRNCESLSACLSARYVLCILIFGAISLEGSHRACMNITIVAMVNHSAEESAWPNTSDDYFHGVEDTYEYRKSQAGKYAWSSSVQGIILGAYYYGTVFTPLIGGRLAEVCGGKWLLGGGILISSTLCLITPSAADIGVAAVVSSRVIMGFAHGACLPAAFAMFSKWSPVEERSTLLSICKVGELTGMILSLLISGYLCEKGFAGGWPSAFYVQGILGCVWFISWATLAHNSPDDHPRISEKELEFIKRNQNPSSEEKKMQLPWKDMVTSLPIWSLVITNFTSVWGYVTLTTQVPTYFDLVMHIPIPESGMFNSLAYFFGCWVILLSGYISDRLQKTYSTSTVRKSFQFVAITGCAIFTALFPSAVHDKSAAIALFVLAFAFMSLIGGGHYPVPMDIAPQYAGTIFGFVTGVASISGILAPLVAGLMLDHEGGNASLWGLVFYTSAGITFLSTLVFTLTGSAELQPWARDST